MSGKIKSDEDKVKSIVDWPTPNNVKELQAYIGAINFHRRFIKNYTKQMLPLYELIKKDKSLFKWGERQQTAFENSKRSIKEMIELKIPNPSEPFIVVTDASEFAIGAVLIQDEEPVAYESRKLSPAEKNYTTHDKEMLAIIYALKTWRHYLLGSEFEVFTDHRSLTHFFDQKDLNKRQVRWTEVLSEYNVKIVYKTGKAVLAADSLSRRPDYEICNIDLVQDDLLNEIKNLYEEDKKTSLLIHQVNEKEYSTLKKGYKVNNNMLYMNDRLYIPKNKALYKKIISTHHDNCFSGHFGVEKTYELLSRSYYWPSMKESLINYISTCDTCQRHKASNEKKSGFLSSNRIPDQPWEVVSIDFITQLPVTKKGHDSIFVVVDRLTKMAHFIAHKMTDNAKAIAQLYIDNVFKLHGLPKEIISDRDSRFTSKFWSSLMETLNIKKNMSTAFHPQTNGQVERINRILEEYLRKFMNIESNNWDEILATSEFAYNNSYSKSTGYSPFYLNLGKDPDPGITIVNKSYNESAEEFSQRIRSLVCIAKDNILKAQESQEKYYNLKRKDCQFKEGDYVLLSTENIVLKDNNNIKIPPKFKPRYIGPYKVLKSISKVAYKVQLPEKMKIHPVFHISLLKEYKGENIGNEDVYENIENGLQEDIPERIIGKKIEENKVYYKVKWKDQEIIDSTWVSPDTISNYEHLVKDYDSTLKIKLNLKGGENVIN